VWFEVIDAELFVFAGVVRRMAEGEADRCVSDVRA